MGTDSGALSGAAGRQVRRGGGGAGAEAAAAATTAAPAAAAATRVGTPLPRAGRPCPCPQGADCLFWDLVAGAEIG